MGYIEGAKVNTPFGRGYVRSRYSLDNGTVLIIETEDKEVHKFAEGSPDITPYIEEEKKSIDTITITREEFRDKITEVIGEIVAKSFITGDVSAVTVLSKIGPVIGCNTEIALFGGLAEENV